MGRILTNEEWMESRKTVYTKCADLGIPEDAHILAHVNDIYLKEDGKVLKYLSSCPESETASIALNLGIIDGNDLNMVKKGMQTATEYVMGDISIAAHTRIGSCAEDERAELQKILIRIDPEYREQILAEYHSVIRPARSGYQTAK